MKEIDVLMTVLDRLVHCVNYKVLSPEEARERVVKILDRLAEIAEETRSAPKTGEVVEMRPRGSQLQ
jgi:hypothetical protein